jgi:hypothetical protein
LVLNTFQSLNDSAPSAVLQDETSYPTRSNTPEPERVPVPIIKDAIASFKTKYGLDIPDDYFEQYGLFGLDQVPITREDWYIDKLNLTEEVAEKWTNHITGIYNEYKAKVTAAYMRIM